MKLKYYLRGLGTGVLVTAFILGIALSHGKGTMSDEEIKEKAAELGMVEEYKSLAEVSVENKDTDNSAEEEQTGDSTSEKSVSINESADNESFKETDSNQDKESTLASDNDPDAAEEDDSEEASAKENSDESGFGSSIEPQDADDKAAALAEEEKEESKKTVILEVQSGDGSQTVARRAAALGLVSDAAEFDRFLCSNGYDKKICTGKHEIPEDAVMEEIAKLLIQKP